MMGAATRARQEYRFQLLQVEGEHELAWSDSRESSFRDKESCNARLFSD